MVSVFCASVLSTYEDECYYVASVWSPELCLPLTCGERIEQTGKPNSVEPKPKWAATEPSHPSLEPCGAVTP